MDLLARLHLTPKGEPECVENRGRLDGNLVVNSYMKIVDHDKRRRMERTAMRFDIYTPTQQFRLQDELHFRTYTRAQFTALLSRVPQWKCVETFDFAYDIENPIKLDDKSEDVVFVLRRQKG